MTFEWRVLQIIMVLDVQTCVVHVMINLVIIRVQHLVILFVYQDGMVIIVQNVSNFFFFVYFIYSITRARTSSFCTRQLW